jgi:hypothetical protein
LTTTPATGTEGASDHATASPGRPHQAPASTARSSQDSAAGSLHLAQPTTGPDGESADVPWQPPAGAAAVLGAAIGVLAYGAMLEALSAARVLRAGDVDRNWATDYRPMLAALAVATLAGLWGRRSWMTRTPARRRYQWLFAVAAGAGVYSALAFVEMHVRTDIRLHSGFGPFLADLFFVHAVGLWTLWGAGEGLLHLRRRAALRAAGQPCGGI